jgi:hypothetical protein
MAVKLSKRDAVRVVLSRGYFERADGPEVQCPGCGVEVQCYRDSSKSPAAVIRAGFEAHIRDMCEVLEGRYSDAFADRAALKIVAMVEDHRRAVHAS